MKLDKAFIGYIKNNKKIIAFALLLLFGVILIFSSSAFDGTKQTDTKKDTLSLDEYKAKLESEVASLCSSVDGVGKCRVFITFERGEQSLYKGSSVTEIKPPRVQGVSVVCRGADSDYVRSRLTEMITALFDIGSNRVAVLKLNS